MVPIRAIAIVCSIALGSTVFLSACGQPDETAVGLTVPALWANESGVGGIERAGITVNTSADTPEFTVNLEDVDSSGAGPAWRAGAVSLGARPAAGTLLAGSGPCHLFPGRRHAATEGRRLHHLPECGQCGADAGAGGVSVESAG